MSRILDFADGFESNTEPTESGGNVSVQDEGSGVTNTPHSTINFVGAGVTTSDAGSGVVTVTIPGGGSGVSVEEEGTAIPNTPHTTLNFIGTAVTAADAGSGEATITIVSQMIVQDEGVNVTNTPHQTLDFVGGGVTVSDGGSGVATITIPENSITMQEEGSNVTNTPHTTINFVGTGVTVTDGGSGVATVTLTSELLFADEGTNVTNTPHTRVDFVGAGVTATDGGSGTITVTIPGGGTDDDAIHDNVAAEINAITEKTTPVKADLILIEDSADTNNKKKVQLGNADNGIHLVFAAGTLQYLITDQGSLTVAASFLYTAQGIPFDTVRASATVDGGGDFTIAITVFDRTNSNTIASVAAFNPATNGVFEQVDLGTVSNVPTAPAILEIQLSISDTAAGREGWLEAISFY